MARRFFIEKDIEVREEFKIEGEEAKHIMVLRHNIGDEILVNDKVCKIKDITKKEVICVALSQEKRIEESNIKITLFQSLLKSDKLEFVIQKCVELGIYKIVPFISKNVVVKVEEKDKVKKSIRWNKISLEASKQCGRSDIVKVEDMITFPEMINMLKDFELVILAYENETKKLKEVINKNLKVKNIAIIIGPEGGFNKDEVQEVLNQNNVNSVSLGSRILRAETASLNLVSILMYEFDEQY